MTAPTNPVSWADLFGVWALLEADFQEVYGIDLAERIRGCSWRWFAVRASGLLSCDSRIHRRFTPAPAQ